MFFQGDGMSVEWTALGSGSKGNCSYLEYGSTRLLIDAGLSGKQIRERLAAIGKSAERLNGILLTHEHSAHIQGELFDSRWRIPNGYSDRLGSRHSFDSRTI